MKLGTQVGLGRGHIVLDGDIPASLPKGGGASPQCSAYIRCGQMAVWIKMLLGREVGLSRNEIVLDGTQLPLPKRGRNPPNFRFMFIVAIRLDGSKCHLVGR